MRFSQVTLQLQEQWINRSNTINHEIFVVKILWAMRNLNAQKLCALLMLMQ